MEKVEFFVVPEFIGEVRLSGVKTWSDVARKLDEDGWTNIGKVKVIKRTYRLLCEEPQFINTDY